MTPLIALFARWGLPEWVRRPLAIATAIIAVASLCGLLWSCWLRSHDAEVIADHETKVTAQVIEASASASIAAVEAAAVAKSEVEAGNAKARAAAAKSDDPLRDGLKALGKGPASSTK